VGYNHLFHGITVLTLNSVEIGDALYAFKQRNYWPAKLLDFIPATTQEDQRKGRNQCRVQIWGDPSPVLLNEKNVVYRTQKEIAELKGVSTLSSCFAVNLCYRFSLGMWSLLAKHSLATLQLGL
jgi:hypothetical protein